MDVEAAGRIMFRLILFLIVAHSLCSLWIELLNLGRLKKGRGFLPPVFEGRVDPDEVARSEDYSRSQMKLGLFSFLLVKAIFLTVILAGGFTWISRQVESLELGPIASGLLFFGLLSLAVKIVGLPFEWYETFRLEERFGFNRTTGRLWIADMAKELALFVILGGGLLAAVLLLLYEAGTWWWVICWAVLFLFSLVMNLLYPVLIAPLFNKFTPLEEGSLEEKVLALMSRAGITIRGVLVMDAGKRSRHTNAYFTGFGRTKRIVLYDTLIEMHGEDEIVAVLAHEAGHWKKKHLLKGFLEGQVLSFALLAATGWFVRFEPLYSAFGFDTVVPYAGLFLASLLYGPLMFLFKPAVTFISRSREFDADRYAGRDMGLAGPLRDALVRLALENLSNLNPHPVYVAFNYSHPPVEKRVELLGRFCDQ